MSSPNWASQRGRQPPFARTRRRTRTLETFTLPALSGLTANLENALALLVSVCHLPWMSYANRRLVQFYRRHTELLFCARIAPAQTGCLQRAQPPTCRQIAPADA